MKKENKVWDKEENRLYLNERSEQLELLSTGVYKLHVDQFGRFYLTYSDSEFKFDYKLYGLETALVDRVVKTYENTTHGNVGVLLNGLKGTGKTVTTKIICNKLNLPTIVVGSPLKGCHLFLNSIPQNITILIDEYEKIFGTSTDMLTIMDGALNSEFRRVFMLTTNKLSIDANLIQRPGRIRYLKKFNDLSPTIVEEIVDDVLIHKARKHDCIQFISTLETITVDIVKAVLQEVNIHDESPESFADVFNVKKLEGKFNIKFKEGEEFVSRFRDVTIYPRPRFDEGSLGYTFQVGNGYLGEISEILDAKTIVVKPCQHSPKWFTKPETLTIENSHVYHYNYKFGEYGGYKAESFDDGFAVKNTDDEEASEMSPIAQPSFANLLLDGPSMDMAEDSSEDAGELCSGN